jgi:nicotinate-nucleotide adenylyltransferase
MRTALFGGSFNPPHNGHVHLISTVTEHTDYERILLIPLHTPSHKDVEVHIDPSHRVEMVRLLAAACCARCRVDTTEIERGGVSYTWDTVQELTRRYTDITGHLGIVIGDDLLEGLPSWHCIDSLKRTAEFTVLCRKLDETQMEDYRNEYGKMGISLRLIKEQAVEVSSSMIREKIRSHQSVEGLLPEPILQYIEVHGLYSD